MKNRSMATPNLWRQNLEKKKVCPSFTDLLEIYAPQKQMLRYFMIYID